MWLFNQFPKDAVSQKYKFDVTPEFLDHLRLSSVRIGGGSGAFVSPNGLILTNQHLISGCLEAHKALEKGFYAAEKSAEIACPGLEAEVLTSIEDVTSQIKAGAGKAAAAQAIEQRQAAISRLEKTCQSPGTRCSVVELYSGVRYDLYRYKVYSDLRLVFAPERQLAYFGAERDSINYLRYGLDTAFLRAYENGQAAATANHLKWSAAGVQDGDLVFSAGDPRETARLSTAAQLTFYRDTELPLEVSRLESRIKLLSAFAAKSDHNQQAAQPAMQILVTAYKTAAGKLIGLRDDRLANLKTAFEGRIRHSVESNAKLGADAGKVWDQVAAAYKAWTPFEKAYRIVEASPAPGSELFRAARAKLRHQDPGTAATLDPAVESALLAAYIEELKGLGERDAPIKAFLAGKTPEEAVAQPQEAAARLAAALEPSAQRLRKKHADMIDSLEASAGAKIAQYRLQLFGASEYPEGTGTPRVEFGVVKGYTDRAGVANPYASTFSGVYYRHNDEGPYQVPQRWVDLRASLDPVAPLDFVSTCDIGGGDAGGPVVNRAGELVGVTFDGNLESLPETFLYSGEQARAVHVAAQGIVEALAKIYKAGPLLQELGIAAPENR